MGSGGSYLGRLIASQMSLKYVDREVLHLAAEEFGCEEEDLAGRAERISSFWERILHGLSLGPPEIRYVPPPPRSITDEQLFEKQTEIMKEIAKKNDCVIVGWGGVHVLPPHRGKFNIFCHAPTRARIKRVMKIYKVQDEEEARAMIEESDEMRKRYIFEMTGKDWACAENYHLSVDTSLLPLPKIAEFVVELVRLKGIGRKA
jgi:cytidylate kinase